MTHRFGDSPPTLGRPGALSLQHEPQSPHRLRKIERRPVASGGCSRVWHAKVVQDHSGGPLWLGGGGFFVPEHHRAYAAIVRAELTIS